MNRFELLLLVAASCLIFGHMQFGSALKCYVCKGCDLTYNETHLTQCEAEEPDEVPKLRCIKRDMIDGEIERDCGMVDDCKVQSEDDKKTRKTGDSYTNRGRKPRRFARQLLQTSKKEENLNITTEFTSLSCCKEDECNGAFSLLFSTKSSPMLAISILMSSFRLHL